MIVAKAGSAPLFRFALLLLALVASVPGLGRAAIPSVITIHYIERQIERPPVLSNFDPPPEDEGLRGAELAIVENTTTGKFVGLSYRLKPTVIGPEEDFRKRIAELFETEKPKLILVNAPAQDLLALTDLAAAYGALVLNAGAPDTRLRDGDCRENLLHTLPSRDMLTDALVQYLVVRQWSRIFLISGVKPGDKLYADAVRNSAKKFGARLVGDKTFDAQDADLRQSAGAELAVATQGPEYDVVVVADEEGNFGPYLPYHTWLPRPVAGTQGMTPVAWARPVEDYGAAQLQRRFIKLAGRSMTSIDFAAWLAVRAIGEAAIKTDSTEATKLGAALRSGNVELSAFKGRALSFRPWNGQLRQPIPLVWPGAVVAMAPLEGFLHQTTELDTLGLDSPETACKHPS
jgi:ABC transporter substrate binding protein (PQQ-dependent alcohol dehydrogenase system)